MSIPFTRTNGVSILARQEDDFTSEGAPPPEATLVGWLQQNLSRELEHRKNLERAMAHAQAELLEARARLAEATSNEYMAWQVALLDCLTQLPNRRWFRQHLQQQLEESAASNGPRLAVVYIDIDRFKPINDLHGHDAGDQALKIIAARLAHAVRAEDMMSRLGGDEFACLLTQRPDRPQLIEFAVKLMEVVSAPMTIAGHSMWVRPSIGIALGPDYDGASADTLIRSADRAMLYAKRGRCGVAFYDECASIAGAAHGSGAAVL
ncbi:MAG: GGDEF domain-containing protein [Chromatiales bacterium]|nr:GGDEF domain-containing protein [Chromatiales bacterium]